MKNKIILSASAAVILCAGIIIGCCIKCGSNKLAVVDVTAVVNSSSEVKNLKNDVEVKTQELTHWLQKAKEDVKSESDKTKQEALLQQYNAEFAQKRAELAKDYNEKLQNVDKSINATIIETAKAKGYKSVIAKGVVIYGGDDITNEVIKVMK